MFKHHFKPTDHAKVGDIIAFNQGPYGWFVGLVQLTYTSTSGAACVKVLAYTGLKKHECELKASLIRDGHNGHTIFRTTQDHIYIYTPNIKIDQARGAVEMYDALMARLLAKKEA